MCVYSVVIRSGSRRAVLRAKQQTRRLTNLRKGAVTREVVLRTSSTRKAMVPQRDAMSCGMGEHDPTTRVLSSSSETEIAPDTTADTPTESDSFRSVEGDSFKSVSSRASSKGNSPFPTIDGTRSAETGALRVSWGAWSGSQAYDGTAAQSACKFRRASSSATSLLAVPLKRPSRVDAAPSMTHVQPAKPTTTEHVVEVGATPSTTKALARKPRKPAEQPQALARDGLTEDELEKAHAAHKKRLLYASFQAFDNAAARKMMRERKEVRSATCSTHVHLPRPPASLRGASRLKLSSLGAAARHAEWTASPEVFQGEVREYEATSPVTNRIVHLVACGSAARTEVLPVGKCCLYGGGPHEFC